MEYKIRKPQASDLPVVCKIIRGIGLKNIAKCFDDEELVEMRKYIKDNNIKTEDIPEEMQSKSALIIILSIVDLIFEKMEDVQKDLFRFISKITSLDVKEVEALSLVDLTTIVMAILKEPDFQDFIKVVLKSFN